MTGDRPGAGGAGERPVTSIGDLAARLATRTAALRDRLAWLLDQPTAAGDAARAQHAAWRRAFDAESTPDAHADAVAQVVSHGMVVAALMGSRSGGLAGAHGAVGAVSPIVETAFGPLVEEPLRGAVRAEVAGLEALIGAIDAGRGTAGADWRGAAWLQFYEDFLGAYDPVARRQAGVYYTPAAVVAGMVALVDRALVAELGVVAGFADPSVVTVDPAAGTGAFTLAVVERAAGRADALWGPDGRTAVAGTLARNLRATEVMPGPCAIAQLRLAHRLRQLDPEADHAPPVEPADALTTRVATDTAPGVAVVIGNPPYRRLARGALAAPGTAALFDDLRAVAREHTIFSHHASLYNLYAAFWRWAIREAFEAREGPAVVAFVTASSWLTGPGFAGLRQLVREVCDAVWVLDLGGDTRGARADQNAFAIGTPVAVVVLVRAAAHHPTTPARVRYRRVCGARADKLAAMQRIADADDPLAGPWEDAPTGPRDPMVPETGDPVWAAFPALADLFPWRQPGMMWNRTWPVAPDPETLARRWRAFADAKGQDRAALFVTPPTGRTIHTAVRGLPPLASLPPGAPSPPVARHAFRAFDRQWMLDDPRLCALERPALAATRSDRQLFLVSLMSAPMSAGPCITVATEVPDKHHFRGSFGGRDVIPLYRDAGATDPNPPAALLAAIGAAQGGAAPAAEDLAAYVYALLSAPAYQDRFAEPLRTPGPRVPLTADPSLWRDAVGLGSWLLWLHTGARRYRDPRRGPTLPDVAGLAWRAPVRALPASPKQVRYDRAGGALHVGDGVVRGVRPDVWAFRISGMPVVAKWLGFRTATGSGRSASSTNPLDRIRPTRWHAAWSDELLDLLRVLTLTCDRHDAQRALLDRICAGPLVPASELPRPES